jgi:uncharacterized protein YodC (DUF2158 family)
MTDFKPGDVVRIKSGGPKMTVAQIGQRASTGDDSVWCVWFEGAKKCGDVFPPDALMIEQEETLQTSSLTRPRR